MLTFIVFSVPQPFRLPSIANFREERLIEDNSPYRGLFALPRD